MKIFPTFNLLKGGSASPTPAQPRQSAKSSFSLLISQANRQAALKAPGSLEEARRALDDLKILLGRTSRDDLALVHRLGKTR